MAAGAGRRTIASESQLGSSCKPIENAISSRRQTIERVIASTALITAATARIPVVNAAYLDPSSIKITQRAYLDVIVQPGGEKQRITIGLYGDAMPRTVDNFVGLCRENSYAGTTFYRVLSDYTIQGGAIGDGTGKTGRSAGGEPFEPDNYNIRHNVLGLVSMVRTVSGAADSRFFISCVEDAGWADDRYAAFGIVENMDVVRQIEKVDVKRPLNAPKEPVQIVASGLL